ncbi:SSU processome protein utp24 [Halogeometricum pallidum JCM 14848]|uniref:SSU processome protein utp24 n=1 Tax=Halogeometricum pallidum JCM 14848 TaxID=1227487 RepID=M0DIR8_HALPD|nr:PIN domain-containing protein [Halogeometricum pallidum]ELZ34049.1 SSU processome protein utp24 [Halogeometricum pallidum JCM 14848]
MTTETRHRTDSETNPGAERAATTVLLDTNALMMPVELDVRVFEELDRLLAANADLVVPEPVVRELEKLSAGGGTEAVAASVGSDLAADRCRVVDAEETYADDAVVELAERGVDYVVTNDRPLRDRLLERSVRVIGIRGRNKLDITEP